MMVKSFVPIIGSVDSSRLGPLDMRGWSVFTPVVRQRNSTIVSLGYCRLLKMDSRLLIPTGEEDHDIGFCIYKRVSNIAARTFLSTRIKLMNLIVKESNTPLTDIKP
jgi:hypothetical protein